MNLRIAIAIAFTVGAFAAYVALFRGVVGEKVIHLTVAGATRSRWPGWRRHASSPRGRRRDTVLTYWALRRLVWSGGARSAG